MQFVGVCMARVVVISGASGLFVSFRQYLSSIKRSVKPRSVPILKRGEGDRIPRAKKQ